MLSFVYELACPLSFLVEFRGPGLRNTTDIHISVMSSMKFEDTEIIDGLITFSYIFMHTALLRLHLILFDITANGLRRCLSASSL